IHIQSLVSFTLVMLHSYLRGIWGSLHYFLQLCLVTLVIYSLIRNSSQLINKVSNSFSPLRKRVFKKHLSFRSLQRYRQNVLLKVIREHSSNNKRRCCVSELVLQAGLDKRVLYPEIQARILPLRRQSLD